MSKQIDNYLQQLIEANPLSSIGNIMGKQIGKKNKKIKIAPTAIKIKNIHKMKDNQCSKRPTPELKQKCIQYYNKMLSRIRESLTENFLQSLYTDNRPQAKEWRGANIPYGDDSNRPNLIRKCMTMESDRQKINCLRKLRDQVAMNPFYQARLDRFVDAITQTYEPTDQPGTIPGNEFGASIVGE